MQLFMLEGGELIEISNLTSIKDGTRSFDYVSPEDERKTYPYGDEVIYGVIHSVNAGYDVRLLLDTIFNSCLPDYQPVLISLSKLYSGTLIVITNKGARASTAGGLDTVANPNSIIHADGDSVSLIQGFLRVVDHNADVRGLASHDAITEALNTGVLGDGYTARIPRWYTKAQERFNRKEDSRTSE